MFNIGDKVIYTDDSVKPELLFSMLRDFQDWVEKDKEYTIRDVFYNDNIVSGVVLKEIANKPIFIRLLGRKQEPAFATWRFKKLKNAPIEVEEQECIVKIHGVEVDRMKIPHYKSR